MNNIFFKTLFKKGAKGDKGARGINYEVPANAIIGFDDDGEGGTLPTPAGYDDATLPPYLVEKTIRANGVYEPANDGAFGYSNVNVDVDGETITLVAKSATENGLYNPTDDNADGYSSFRVNVSGGGGAGVDGIYFDGTTTNVLSLPFSSNDYEYEIKFYIPRQQKSKMIFGTTTNGYYPVLFMNATTGWTLPNGSGGQIQYVPTNGFEGEHTVILNRLSDRAIIFDDNNLGTYGTNYFSTDNRIDIGTALSINAAEFVLKEFKITDHSTGVVLADYVAGFTILTNGVNIPCLLNKVDNTYIDLNTGRSTGNNGGHVMVCQETTYENIANWDFADNTPWVDSINGNILDNYNVTIFSYSSEIKAARFNDSTSCYLKIPSNLIFSFNGNYKALEYEIGFISKFNATSDYRMFTMSNNWGNSSDRIIGLMFYNGWNLWYNSTSHLINGGSNYTYFDNSIIKIRFEKVDDFNMKISIYKDDYLVISSENIPKSTYETFTSLSLGSFRNPCKFNISYFKIKKIMGA